MPKQIVDWKHQVIDQADFYWDGYFFSRIQDLGDEEYFWEPVDNCWTVHPADDGTFWLDIQRHPAPDPEPFTTIAWRISHLIKVFGQRASRQFGDNSFDGEKFQVFGTAKEAIAELVYRRNLWRDGLLALTEEELGRPTGPTEGRYENDPLATLVMHVHREFMHHGGEICLLRDLYRYKETLGA